MLAADLICSSFRLSAESVLRSPSECNAVVRAFMECLRYTLTADLHHALKREDLLNYLLDEVSILTPFM